MTADSAESNSLASIALRPVGDGECAPQRLFFLDWLRIAAIGLLVLYHTGMYYVTWGFHVKSPFASAAIEPLMKLAEPWRMSLLFMVSGAATALMFKNGATVKLLKSRARFLLLPLLFGVFIVIAPQSYFEVIEQYGYSGNFWQFWGLYLTHSKAFCQGSGCLILPTWNHLWFLPYLFTYTLLLWLFLRWRPHALATVARLALPRLQGAGLLVWPILLLGVLRVNLEPLFPKNYTVWGDWFYHSLYFAVFLAGAMMAQTSDFWLQLERWRWPALCIALFAWAIFANLPLPRWQRPWLVVIFQWSALVAAFGWARHYLNADHPWRERLVQAVFPVYILHQTIIIVASQWLKPLRWQPLIEGPVIVALAFSLSYAGYLLALRVHWLQPWMGVRGSVKR